MTKIKKSNWDKNQKPKLWPNSKTQFVTKLKNTNCDKTQKVKLWQNLKLKLWQNSKTQMVTKLKKKSNCDKTNKENKLWQNSKSKIVTKLKSWNVTKLKKNSNYNQTQRLKLWQLKSQIKKKFWNSNCQKNYKKIVTKLEKTNFFSGQLYAILAMFFL